MHIVDSFFVRALEINIWTMVRKRFLPENKGSWKTGVLKKDQFSISSLQPVLFPIHCSLSSKTNNHWTLVVRYPAKEDSQKDWDFVLIDSANNDGLACSQREAFDLRTTLHFRRGTMDEPDPTAASTLPSALFIRHRTIAQVELECGFRMLLHMYVAGFCCSAKEFCRAINKLRAMDSETLAQRCRN